MYKPHPSQQLTDLFRAKPYQGAPPQDAEFVFVGLDANYDANIESSPAFFDRVWEYHKDGVAFWRHHQVHHPFLLNGYNGSGQLYHRNFARIGFEPEDACRVSFVELLHIPTVGVSQLVAEDLDIAHLDWLNSLIKLGARRKVFLSDKVVRLMRQQAPRALRLAAQSYCEEGAPSTAHEKGADVLPAPALRQLGDISRTHDA